MSAVSLRSPLPSCRREPALGGPACLALSFAALIPHFLPLSLFIDRCPARRLFSPQTSDGRAGTVGGVGGTERTALDSERPLPSFSGRLEFVRRHCARAPAHIRVSGGESARLTCASRSVVMTTWCRWPLSWLPVAKAGSSLDTGRV